MPWPTVADVFSGFDKVFSRMTAVECDSICDAYGLLDSAPSVPSYLTAEGALTWMAYNEDVVGESSTSTRTKNTSCA